MATLPFEFSTLRVGSALTLTIKAAASYADPVTNFDITVGYQTGLAAYVDATGGSMFTVAANGASAGTVAASGIVSDGGLGVAGGPTLVTITFTLLAQAADFPLTLSGAALNLDAPASGSADPAIPCFAQGTRIRAGGCEVPVEALRIGDSVATHDGPPRRVVWIGHRRLDCEAHPRPQDVMPVRVAAGAVAAGVPARDLVLSPDHAIFLDGVLIPVRYLINGATIVQESRAAVTYYHVELDRHAVVFADGLPCESYLDTGNRSAFANGGTTVQLHPDFARDIWHARACAPLVLAGPRLAAARRRLLERCGQLGYRTTLDPELHVEAGGRRIAPLFDAGGMYRFALPAGVRELVVRSRGGVPAEIAPMAADHRWLGVMVERIILRQPRWRREILLEDIPDGSGFYPLERDTSRRWRWTNGSARLCLSDGIARDGQLLLDILVGKAQDSWLPAHSIANGMTVGAHDQQGVRARNPSETGVAHARRVR